MLLVVQPALAEDVLVGDEAFRLVVREAARVVVGDVLEEALRPDPRSLSTCSWSSATANRMAACVSG